MEGGTKKYLDLRDLEVYRLARKHSALGWRVYSVFNWHLKKIIGDQMITSIDSVGANIAEGYGRFHYLDKNKFYYNARGSLLEAQHWLGVMLERKLITDNFFKQCKEVSSQLLIKLNTLIKVQYNKKV